MFSICSNIIVLTKYLVTLLELRERGCPSSQVTGITLIQSRVGGKDSELLKEAGPESILFVKQELEYDISRIGAQARTQPPPQRPPSQFEFPIPNALELPQLLLE